MKWARADGTGIISENATGRCAARDSVAVLNACAIAGALESVHNKIIESGCEFDVFVGSSLIDIYAKCGSMEDAWRMFNKMPSWNVVTFTAMISGHVKCGQGQKALELF
jgi:pentatricopeptide repeat protein